MGFFDDLLGNTAADAAKKAAADQYAKQQAASAGLRTAGDQYNTGMESLSHGYDPWRATGGAANDAVLNLIRDPSSVRSLPGYQFGLDQGNRSIAHAGVGNGNLFSGKTGKAFESYGINYADQKYGDQLARLLGVSQQGLGATQAGINTAGTGLQGQLGARASSYGQDFNSAGTIGQGDIAAANAKAKGAQGLLNLGGSLLGSAISAGTGGFSSLLGGGGGISGWDTYGGTPFPKVGSGWG